jgi:tetratricopeptide (TPR) repeat protein
MARKASDPSTLAAALFARATSLESTDLTAERRALAEELVDLGRTAGTRAAMATTHGLRVLAGVSLELGDADALSSTIAEFARAGERQRWLPALVFEGQWRATRALLEGRFNDVTARWEEMRRHARAYRGVGNITGAQSYYLARELGELAPIAASLEQITEGPSESLYVPAMLALAQLDTGDEESALHTLDSLSADDLRRAQGENAWGSVLALLAEVAASGATPSKAAVLYEMLDPFAGRLISAVIGLACLGAAERFQGMLSATLERWDDAEAHFERALELEERIRGRALLPRTRYWQARFFRARARPGDDDAAAQLLAGVAQETQRLGMRRLHEQAERLLAG